MEQTQTLSCQCGQVRIEAQSSPITSTECHCNSCREAAVRLCALPAAPAFQAPNGGTRFVLYRKDRVRFVAGHEQLREFRLAPGAGTRRVVATCCSTPVFLEFAGGHWLSLYGCLWPTASLPRLEERTMTGDLDDKSRLTDEVPNQKRQSIAFFVKLLRAWVAMGFHSPKITVQGSIHG